MPPIRVALADDEAEIREAISDLISLDTDLDFVGAASDTVSAVTLASITEPDVMLMDVRIPPHGGARAASDALKASPGTRIIAYSAFDDRASVVEMLRAGAVAYVTKSSPAEEVLTAIHRVMDGASTLSPEVSAQLIDELGHHLRREKLEQEEREATIKRVRRAIAEADAMRPVYQPIIDLASKEVTGLEALARFDTTDRPPNVWFEDATRVGLGPELEMEAARRATAALEKTSLDLYLSINFFPPTICSPEFSETLRGSWSDRLVLEITEHAAIEDYEALAAAPADARAAGVRVAVDDTGSGYASLRHILRLEPDLIKLDIELTSGLEADPRRRALARALISFASDIGAEIVAEGIETAAEVDALTELGVRWGQGYLLGRPAPLDELLDQRLELRQSVTVTSDSSATV